MVQNPVPQWAALGLERPFKFIVLVGASDLVALELTTVLVTVCSTRVADIHVPE
jgi:hypothetical protein